MIEVIFVVGKIVNWCFILVMVFLFSCLLLVSNMVGELSLCLVCFSKFVVYNLLLILLLVMINVFVGFVKRLILMCLNNWCFVLVIKVLFGLIIIFIGLIVLVFIVIVVIVCILLKVYILLVLVKFMVIIIVGVGLFWNGGVVVIICFILVIFVVIMFMCVEVISGYLLLGI